MTRDFIGEVQKQQTQTTQGQNHPANQGTLTNAMQDTGAYNIPVLGGVLRGITQPANQLLETAGADAAGAYHMLTNGGQKLSPDQVPFISPEEKQSLLSPQAKQTNPIQNAVGYEAQQAPVQIEAVADVAGFKGVPGLIKGAIDAPKYLIPALTGKAIEQAAADATANGVTTSAPGFIRELIPAIEKKLAGPGGINQDPELMKSFGKVLRFITGRSEQPEELAQVAVKDPNVLSGHFTPENLTKMRSNITTRYGYNPSGEGTLDNQVANIARQVASKQAKQITPGLTNLDKAYSMQQKYYPKIAKAAGIGTGGLATAELLSSLLKGMGSNNSNNGDQSGQ